MREWSTREKAYLRLIAVDFAERAMLPLPQNGTVRARRSRRARVGSRPGRLLERKRAGRDCRRECVIAE